MFLFFFLYLPRARQDGFYRSFVPPQLTPTITSTPINARCSWVGPHCWDSRRSSREVANVETSHQPIRKDFKRSTDDCLKESSQTNHFQHDAEHHGSGSTTTLRSLVTSGQLHHLQFRSGRCPILSASTLAQPKGSPPHALLLLRLSLPGDW